MLKELFRPIRALLLAIFAVVAVTACGGGGGGGGGATGSSSSLSGTAATGAPVSGTVTVRGSNGAEASTQVGADGSFSVSVQGLTAPYILRVVPTGGGDALYSFASAGNITVNITPLTTLALFLTNKSDLAALYDTWSTSSAQLTDAAIELKQAVINANLSSLFGGEGIDATFYDFMNVAFNADGTGIDGVLDALAINITFASDTYSILVNGVPFSLNEFIDTSAINLGDFGIDANSTWTLTVTDSANNISFSETVFGLVVPNDDLEFEDFGFEELNGTFSADGVTVTFNFSGFSFNVNGTGAVGTTISGIVTGSVRVTGVFEGQPIDQTFQINTSFTWTRIS